MAIELGVRGGELVAAGLVDEDEGTFWPSSRRCIFAWSAAEVKARGSRKSAMPAPNPRCEN
jgi:hypothetical protein